MQAYFFGMNVKQYSRRVTGATPSAHSTIVKRVDGTQRNPFEITVDRVKLFVPNRLKASAIVTYRSGNSFQVVWRSTPHGKIPMVRDPVTKAYRPLTRREANTLKKFKDVFTRFAFT